MDKIISIALVALAGYKVISSFIQNMEVGNFFGQEINIWIYRGIWLFVGLLALNTLIRKIRKKQ